MGDEIVISVTPVTTDLTALDEVSAGGNTISL